MRFRMTATVASGSASPVFAAAAGFGAMACCGRAEVRATAGGGADFLLPINDVYHVVLAGFELLTISK